MVTLENIFQRVLYKEGRFWPRLRCRYNTNCRDSHGNQWACKIINISGRGLGIVLNAELRAGEMVYLAEPAIKAIVVWISEGRVGLRVCN